MKIELKDLLIPVGCIMFFVAYGLNVGMGFILIILSHELGHALLAHRQGIFKQFDIHPSGNPMVVTAGDFNNRTDYFAGIILNTIFIPILSPLFVVSWADCVIICLAMGMLDIIKFGQRWREERTQNE